MTELDRVFEGVKHDKNRCQGQIYMASHRLDELKNKERQVRHETEMLRSAVVTKEQDLARRRQVRVSRPPPPCPLKTTFNAPWRRPDRTP